MVPAPLPVGSPSASLLLTSCFLPFLLSTGVEIVASLRSLVLRFFGLTVELDLGEEIVAVDAEDWLFAVVAVVAAGGEVPVSSIEEESGALFCACLALLLDLPCPMVCCSSCWVSRSLSVDSSDEELDGLLMPPCWLSMVRLSMVRVRRGGGSSFPLDCTGWICLSVCLVLAM